jgi:hypothetical protein
METQSKLFIAVGTLAVLGGALYFQNKSQKEEAKSYTVEGRKAELPKLEITEEQSKVVDKIVLSKPAGDAGKALDATLEKKGETWKLSAPLSADANQTNVTSLLGNLKTLKVTEAIDPGTTQYEKYGVTEGKALHAVFYKGAEVVADFWFGESGSRGQMTRIAGRDGVYAVKGYSGFLYDRELKDWRDRTVFKFEEDKVKSVEIANEHGTFVFAKDKDKWTGKHKKAKDPAAKDLERFDEQKVKDAIRAYKGLNADNFADGKKPADVGLEKPAATITFTLEDGGKKSLQIGTTAEGSSRWAKADSSEEIISVGSWAADWALAEASKFQKPDEKAKGKDGGAAPAPSMPPGMGMPGMPPGMPPGMDEHGH